MNPSYRREMIFLHSKQDSDQKVVSLNPTWDSLDRREREGEREEGKMKRKAGRTRWKEQMEKRRAVRRGRGRRSGRKGGRSVVLLIVVRSLGVQERNRRSIKSLVLLPLLLPSFLSKYGTMSHSVIKSYLWLSSSRLAPFKWGLF